ncbi:MAG: ethylbenzene dehydrogenase-related protein [Candidatus Omnitrophica bacterium]|nr:ethylbenzene dehydrogenase-related protein [Candidatus Omnitrophota bacterium]
MLKITKILIITLYLSNVYNCIYAGQIVKAEKFLQPPVIDGYIDPLWEKTSEIITHDKAADIDIKIKAGYTDREIFFLVQYPDKDESREHKTWTWDKTEQMYVMGAEREDTFVFKWNMEDHPVDLSISSESSHIADIWFWKACRTDPSGYADDKIQKFSKLKSENSREIILPSGNIMYLQRMGDEGREAYKNTLFVEHTEDLLQRFEPQEPSGSRADVKARGLWSDGVWTIEFKRALVTRNIDDIQFFKGETYDFGVSRYEIAGREVDQESDQPLYGMGDVSEVFTLGFEE